MHMLKRMMLTMLNKHMCEVYTYLGSFGSPAERPTRFYSSEPWVQDLGTSRPTQLQRCNMNEIACVARVEKTEEGRLKVYGDRGALKQSQQYPKGLGENIYKLWASSHAPYDEWDAGSVEIASDQPDWDDCEVDSVLAGLGVSKKWWF